MAEHRVTLCMVIHAHQPVGNFSHVIEEAYQRSYLPFLQVLSRHPGIRLSLHYSGVLWEWIEAHHPEFLEMVRGLTESGHVENIGGGYYEPILAAIPAAAQLAQLRRQSKFLQERLGVTPRGVWVAERVWEQGLIGPLAEAGAEFTILDDTHFLAAGEEASALHQVYLTEDGGSQLKLAPSLQSLRYTIPFREPGETLSILRGGAGQKQALFAMGDDCEKFGVWPGTYDHCYTHGWLDRFFHSLEGAAPWLEVSTISSYIADHPPERLIYLPTASYAEMMTWALPARTAEELEACIEEAGHMPQGSRFLRFLRGGIWRNFLSKYPESNQIHKLMLRIHLRWQKLNGAMAGPREKSLLATAENHLLAGQCNDAYWHGVFGGLYAPHLRNALLENLIRAESILDQIEIHSTGAHVTMEDFDLDGREEVMLDHPQLGAVIRPADGGAISSLRSKAAVTELINSLQRRPEAYHRLVKQKSGSQESVNNAPASIHDQARNKGGNLAAGLVYDRYARHAFRTCIFRARKHFRDFAGLCLEENRELAQGAWEVAGASSENALVKLQKQVEMQVNGRTTRLCVTKQFTLSSDSQGWNLDCRMGLTSDDSVVAAWGLGTEIILNLLAPNSPDRYIQAAKAKHPLEFKGEIVAPSLVVVDEWKKLEITLEAPLVSRWWITPIETISQSESGFERIYQGSVMMPVWDIELGAGRESTCRVRMQVRAR